MRCIVVAAGGTGGHLFPAEALASELAARGHRVVLMTDARTGARLGDVFASGENYIVSAAGLAGRGVRARVRGSISLASGVLQARRILARLDAAVIVGFGGYPSVPPIIAARLLRARPRIVLHEQNAVFGRANRFLARFADFLALGFAQTARQPRNVPSRVTGNPVRPLIRALAAAGYTAPEADINLLVLGGSLGARVLSDVVPDAIALLPEHVSRRLNIVQQCRLDDMARVRSTYERRGIAAELAPFFTDIAEKLGRSHLVISRAGASTCAELAVSGRPSILVPLPGAIDDHQTRNAQAVAGAELIRQDELTPTRLAASLLALLDDPSALADRAARAASVGLSDAASALADIVESQMMMVEAAR